MTAESAKVFLASSSPQRFRLLRAMGLDFSVINPQIDETPHECETVREYVLRLAVDKSHKTFETLSVSANRNISIGADTCVTINDDKLGKPSNRNEARRMLELLSGRVHEVHCAVAVSDCSTILSAAVVSEVEFFELTEEQIEAFLVSGESENRAGAYAIQGRAGSFVRRLCGSFSSVIGMPIKETIQLLNEMGVSTPPYERAARNVNLEFPGLRNWSGNYYV